MRPAIGWCCHASPQLASPRLAAPHPAADKSAETASTVAGIITVVDAKHILQQVGRAGVEDVVLQPWQFACNGDTPLSGAL